MAGKGDERYLDYLARCNQAFRPFAPIDLARFFCGRQSHIDVLVRELGTPGRQVAIFGERGVGKTSIATLAHHFANLDDAHYFVRCEQSSTYDTIFANVLMQDGIEFVPNGVETEAQGKASVTAGPVSLGGARTFRTRHQSIAPAQTIGPAMLLKRFSGRKCLLILDEYDRVRDQPTHTRLAETLKHFSDSASTTKIVVVGVADTLSGLIGEHASLMRCVAQIRLDRMTPEELAAITKIGEERTGVVFPEAIRRKIIGLSDGFPFYTHLLCKYCAEAAGAVLRDNPDANVVAADSEYRAAIRQAVSGVEASLREGYDHAIISTKRKTDMYRNLLWAVAYSDDLEVQVRGISENIYHLTGTQRPPQSFSGNLGVLVKEEKRRILTRVRQGYYRFSNPLMRAYVRLRLEEENLLTGGQQEFPWMRAAEPPTRTTRP